MDLDKKINDLENKILELVEEYQILGIKKRFIPGISSVPINGRVFDSNEVKELVKSSIDFGLQMVNMELFSKKMSNFLSMKHLD